MERKPEKELTVAETLALIREMERREICAALPLEFRHLLKRIGLKPCQFAVRNGLGKSYVAEVLHLKKFPTAEWWDAVAERFGLLLEDFAKEGRRIIRGEIPL